MKYPAYVYALTLEATGKKYIGITGNPKRRFSAHKTTLRAGKHPVEDMQDDYNKYGGCISFHILDVAKDVSERSKEFRWQLDLRTLERGKGYNYKDPVTHWCLPIPESPQSDIELYMTQLKNLLREYHLTK